MKPASFSELSTGQAAGAGETKVRLGAITRELHDALRALGAAPQLRNLVREIPDTRSRLSHVADLTEKAAHRVLNLVDEAMPKLTEHGRHAHDMAAAIAQVDPTREQNTHAHGLLMAEARSFALDSVDLVAQQKVFLSEIMMAQDFQDLSGQVIKRVIDMITRTEGQLVQLLIDEADVAVTSETDNLPLQGPQTSEKALAQDDVDELLASMGF